MVLAGLVLGALAFRITWIIYTNHTFEDAFITFQYAKRLANGDGFVYNVGERVYGTTTPLFTLMLAGWLRLFPNSVVTGARLFSFLAVIGTFACTYMTLQKIQSTRSQQFAVLLLISIWPKFLELDTGGMETALGISLMAASWCAFSNGKISLAGVLAGLLLWLRIDLILWIAALAAILLTNDYRKSIRILLIAGLTYLPWMLFATAYFGTPIPHTIVAKQVAYAHYDHIQFWYHLKAVIQKLTPLVSYDYWSQSSPMVIFLTVVMIIMSTWQAVRTRKNLTLFSLSSFALLNIIFLVFSQATFFHRYVAMILWAILVFWGLALGHVWDYCALRSHYRSLYTGVLFLGAIFIFALGWQGARQVKEAQTFRHEASLKSIGLWLNKNTPLNSTVQLEPLGYIGYFADRTMRDVVGLVTPQVTSLKRQGIVDPVYYIPVLHPDFVVVPCDDALRWFASNDEENDFAIHYQRVKIFNPLHFEPDQPIFRNNTKEWLPRRSCYEIWAQR